MPSAYLEATSRDKGTLAKMVARKSAVPRDDLEQSRRFIEVAKEVGATEESKDFAPVFDRVAKSKPVKPSAPHSRRIGKRGSS